MKNLSHAVEKFCAAVVFSIDSENKICYLDKALPGIHQLSFISTSHCVNGFFLLQDSPKEK